MEHKGSLPPAFWIAMGAITAGVIGLFLPWVTKPYTAKIGGFTLDTGIQVQANAFQLGLVGTVVFLLLVAASLLIAVRVGYRTIVEIVPSGPPREIPGLKVWMTLLSLGIVAIPIAVASQTQGSVGPGAWLVGISGIVLWLSALNNYSPTP